MHSRFADDDWSRLCIGVALNSGIIRMPTRTQAQQTGDAAEDIVRALVGAHPNWIARNQDRDFGVDLELELAEIVENDQQLIGQLIKLQVKGTKKLERRNCQVAVNLDRRYLDYARQFRLPVVLVAVDVTSHETWFLWLQKWILENEVQLASEETTHTITARIPEGQTLTAGLDAELQRIARGEENTAIVLALRELVVSASTTGNMLVFDGALEILGRINAPFRIWAIQTVIDALMGLSPHGGFWRAQQLVPQLLALVDRIGNTMSEGQVVRLVARGEAYSRAALYGLSRLYEKWPDHARSLGLSKAFRSVGIEDVAWYCDMREHFPQYTSYDLWEIIGNRKLPTTQFGRLMLSNDEESCEEILLKWPNRGDSVFLDHLVLIDAPTLQT